MVVVQRVVDGLAIPAEPHQLGVLQHPQLVADGGLAQPDLGGNVLDAQLLDVEGVEDLEQGRLTEPMEQVRQLVQDPIVAQFGGGGGAVAKGWPGFFAAMRQLGVEVETDA